MAGCSFFINLIYSTQKREGTSLPPGMNPPLNISEEESLQESHILNGKVFFFPQIRDMKLSPGREEQLREERSCCSTDA